MTDEDSAPPTHRDTWTVSVRELVDFVLRRGRLSRGVFRSARRAHEGSQGHQDIQRQRPANYRAEVPVRDTLTMARGHQLIVQGRIDGVLPSANGWLLEEIKTVVGDWNGEPRELHWAQGKVYAALFARAHALETLDVQLTYLHLDTQDLSVFRQTFATSELDSFYGKLTDVYRAWLEIQSLHRESRDASIRSSGFPFTQLREGQETLLWKTRETLQHRQTLLAEAPTGIGKTISVLYAAAQQLPPSQGNLRLAYLTAKTTGQASARKAVADLREAGIHLNALGFTARDRLCFGTPTGGPCEVETCPFAQHYFDHRQEALREALELGWVGREELRALAEKHQVCPSALALDLVPWIDLVVCDYNYVFDPSVRLAALTNDGRREVALLIDEAHNLPDRARRMFSAEIDTLSLTALTRALGKHLPEARHALENLVALLRDHWPHEGQHQGDLLLESRPRGLRTAIRSFLSAADHCLSRGDQPSFQEALLDTYFNLSRFLKLADMGDRETHALTLGPTAARSRRQGLRLRWLCLDPSPLLQRVYRETGAAVVFSATLSPSSYFSRLLGHSTKTPRLQLPSPFPTDQLGLMVHPGIATTYRKRAASYAPLAQILTTFAKGKSGNYLAFFSSFDYLQQVEDQLRSQRPKGLRVLSQTAQMSLEEREAFISQFRKPRPSRSRTSLLGLAVLGGVFGEGVDLVGDSLIGVAVVGVGLPQVNHENNLIKARFAELEGRGDETIGFDFAYTYPGFSRVLQAIGRLIRSETDRGAALLIDERYRQHRYRELFPAWWEPNTVRDLEDMEIFLETFWSH